jgi:hypothetical protein
MPVVQKGVEAQLLIGRSCMALAMLSVNRRSKYEKQEDALGGFGCLGRSALNVASPAPASTNGTGIAHPDGQPGREGHDDDSENERTARRPRKPMSAGALNYPLCCGLYSALFGWSLSHLS